MRITADHINQFKQKLSFKTESTQNIFMCYVDKFLKHSSLDLSMNSVILYLQTISPNSMKTVYPAIKFFYRANNLDFTVKISDVTSKTHIKVIREALNMDEIKALIKTVRENYGIIDKGYIAVSTVYAARRAEIYNIESNDISEDIGKLYIGTLKGGEGRTHLIPDEIKGVLSDFKDGLKRIKGKPPIENMSYLFDDICNRAGIQLRPRLGFHSLRRSFISELLLTDLNATIVRNFCRWKPRESDIILNYDIKNPERVDKMVFEKHPFLGLWK